MFSLTFTVRCNFSFSVCRWIFSYLSSVIKLRYNSPAQIYSLVNICEAPALAQGEVIDPDIEGLQGNRADETGRCGPST